MNNEKGLTLIEILGSIIIIGIIVTTVSFILQQGTMSSHQNKKKFTAVQITQNAIEELISISKDEDITDKDINVPIFEQSVSLSQGEATIYYPNAQEQQYKLDIKEIPSALPPSTTINTKPIEIKQRYPKFLITCTDLSNQRTYSLEFYLSIHNRGDSNDKE